MSSFLDHALDRLKVCGPITAKGMFGGHGLYSGSIIFGMVANDLLYFKVGAGNQAEYESAGMSPFTYEGKGGRPVRMSYWQVPEEVLEDNDDLRFWFKRAVAEAQKAASEKAKSAKSKIQIGKKPAVKKASTVSKKKAAPKKKVTAKKKAAPKKKAPLKKKPAPKKKSGSRKR
ncbi:competence protein TfoX [Leptospira perolatii]|uniref:Competence protein TfoX n=1 Tax=Leptospira perolatii TaxID=2023191 RepID=A0A2M9ZJD7_9LEPT|nr:TfoX/Sxy family protein [Leptospira perolatii]PJZ68837.1 competence protein TfoX [Leptospira perolatii]PJZ72168.1 competence protein TfoX [Leptospira perolatii]